MSAPPIVEEVSASAEQVLALALALPAAMRPVALDSCGYEEPDARRLIVAFDPFETIVAAPEDPIAALDAAIARFSGGPLEDGLPPGAAIGALSYDLGRRYERLPATAYVDAPCSDASLGLYDLLFVHDYRTGRTRAVSTGLPATGEDAPRRARARLDEALGALAAARPRARDRYAAAGPPESNFTRERYVETVERAKAYIAAGDIFQVNLTQRFSAPLGSLAPEELFLRLRERNPAAFAAWLAEPGRTVVSVSPERFLRASGQSLEMWPIKGTRPRGTTEPEDLRYASELMESEKDRAENVMIVDLVRNDLGRVAEFGSVAVDEICRLRALPTVFHLVSRVSARLRDDATVCDALRAAFPCGSITGAPKIRAMEIVEELEGVRRGLSMGAIGYIGFDGSADWSVAIRTAEIVDGVARFNVGGGIVADSEPNMEYEETLWKGRAILDALCGLDARG